MEILQGAFHDAFSPFALSFVLAAVGLNVHFGYTGLLNFGQAAFAAVGAYGMAVAIASFDVPLFPALLLGIVGSVILALILGVPTLRLRADYLAIVTIAAAEILRLMFSTSFKEYFHARDGVSGFTTGFRNLNPLPDDLTNFATFSRNDLWVMIVGWTLVALVCLYLWLLMRSPWGRVLKSIREDEEAVRSLGKNVYFYKMQALALGGVIGAFGGFIGALGLASVQPDSFNTDFTFIAFTMLILGGAARILGPVVGAVLFWGILSAIGSVLVRLASGDNPIIPPSLMNSDQASNVRFMIVGLVLMLLMIYRPQGLFGDRKEIALDAR
ncbi:branched-chain amino acid ABC transporter permease [Nocardioides seonyuensis]|uniref:Branched-chain amino acid ABC transporter permease n=1 Tax=Nocardioides seonyuensis TaxID=2518371 RepID=A0A4P7IHJ9_9ACTN|nr:branched-chain amino acid ABC transporter permease [Nocardioides seonyuensis]QBX56859.1 branched-chain amino acid ABC transporter permease [Nocardioides seonyuensis]